ncbi:MAG: hypothetical protein J5835_01845 [Bacteroidales bacterium]|nr:hypothetical protein [Bacteroidales bacterium]
MDYDTSRGIDKEMTLFTDKISIPVADIGPFSPKQLLGDTDLGSALNSLLKESEDGYLVVEKEETFYSNSVFYIYYMSLANPTQDVEIDDFTGYPGNSADTPADLGLTPVIQEFSLFAINPLTEGISVSGKMTLSTKEKEDAPANTLCSEVFDNVSVAAESNDYEYYHTALDGQGIIDVCSMEEMILHLPASFLEKDPMGGLNSISLGYRYKAHLAFAKDFPAQIPIPVDDLDLPLGQYKVKDVLLCTEVSNEIPITFVLDSVDVMVKETDEDGNEKTVVCDDVSITPGLTIASGCSGTPVVTPLAISIKAQEGTIPDIAGLQLNLSVKVPTGDGDKRLNMNQSIRFNNLRATVSGGITFQSL